MTHRSELRTRCCARCKTPFWCGSTACPCHANEPALELAAQIDEWAEYEADRERHLRRTR